MLCRYPISLAVSLFLCILSIHAAETDYYFKQISLEQGLTQSRVQSILRDEQGIIWIGTKHGLNSFDQFELTTYLYNKNEKNGLPDNFIRFIAEDERSLIYVSTNKGVVIFDRIKKTFTPILYQGEAFQAWSFYMEQDKIIFGGEYRMLYAYYFDSGKVTPYLTQPSPIKEDRIYNIYKWTADRLILSTKRDGIWVLNTQTKQFEPYPFFTHKEINTIFLDSKNRLWISVYNNGVVCFDPDGNKVVELNTKNSNLSNDIVFDFLEVQDQIWLGTDGGGINIYDDNSGKTSVLKHAPGEPNHLQYNSTYCLYKDADENIWVGTIVGGLLGLKKVYIKTFKDVSFNNPHGLSERAVVTVYQEDDSKLWVGTDGGGLNLFHIERELFTHFKATANDKITAIAPYSENELLLSCFNKGLYLFNKKTEQIRPFDLISPQQLKKEFSYGDLVSIYSTQNELLILGQHIYSIDRISKQSKIIDNPKLNINRKAALRVVGEKTGEIYLLGMSDILAISSSRDSLQVLVSAPEGVEFTSACRDENGNFWIGSNDGLFMYHGKEHQLTAIPTNLFSNISQLILDKKGRLWIGAQNMLFVYIISEKRFVILGESDGVPLNELAFSPYTVQGDYLFIAGNMGLVRINNNIEFDTADNPEIKINNIDLDGISILDKLKGNKVKIPWNHSSVNIRIIVKEKDMFRKHVFRYNISSANDQQIETYSNKLFLGKLQPGKHNIYVSCNTQSGEWSPAENLLEIVVATPWWKSFWFVILLSMLVASVVLYAIKKQLNKKEEKLKWQLNEHENKLNEEKIKFLINISHELRTPLTLIYTPLKRLIEKKVTPENAETELKNIFKQTKQMKQVIDMVLDVRKMELGKEELHFSKHNINPWLTEVADAFVPEFKEKEIRVTFDLDESLGEIIFDENKSSIVLSNLLMNALKFSPVNSTVTIRSRRNGDHVRVEVSDQGMGLDDVDINQLFSRFYQGKHHVKGSGIGLSYAKMLIEMQGGSIWAANNETGGATIYFELPLRKEENIVVTRKEDLETGSYVSTDLTDTTIQIADNDLTPYSVLIVEDESDLRTFLEDALSEYFGQVFSAEDGLIALEKIKKHSPDIVVSDVMMPNMDGFQLCKTIKDDLSISHTPVILLTALSHSEHVITGYKLGADAYLSKPFELELLVSLCANQLKKREDIRKRYLLGQGISLQESTFSNADEKFMLKLNKFINENMQEPDFGIKELLNEMAMSRTSLYDKVKELTGLGVNDYINRIRIEAASRLLINSDMNINEISDRTGFNYPRHFSTLFKKIKGISPSKFREANRQSE